MAPEKFENKIKDLFEEREIKPSVQSWEELEQRLERKDKPRRSYIRWIGAVAAVAVFLLLMGMFFYNPATIETPVIVDAPSEENSAEQEEQQILPKEEVLVSEKEVEQENSLENKVEGNENSARPRVVLVENSPEKEVLVEVYEKQEELISKEIIAEVEPPTPAVKEVSDAEINALLAKAIAELEEQPENFTKTASAEELLRGVEYELEDSFRQKVFEVLKDGYSKAKTAVANRGF